MLEKIQSPEIQSFIRNHENDDEKVLVLQHKHIHDIPSSLIANQIAARRKAKSKLPLFYNTQGIVYPPSVNLEQASSEATALFKTSVVEGIFHPGKNLIKGIDLTCGLGVDSLFLSKLCNQLHCIESNHELLQITRHNHTLLGAFNINHHNKPAEVFLDNFDGSVDFIYIDPSRRTENRKVFTLKDSEPDIVFLQQKIFDKTDHLLVKASPLLDIKLGLRELAYCKKVFVVAVDNEVKELLFHCEKGYQSEASIEAINLKSEAERFEFFFSQESVTEINFSQPLKYLYEPNAAILKAGAFRSIAQHFNINKLHQHTHLYTSDFLHQNFQGRIFLIEQIIKSDPRVIRQYIPEGGVNIVTRNYPLKADELKRKLKLTDGGEKYLLAFSGLEDKFLVITSRIK